MKKTNLCRIILTILVCFSRFQAEARDLRADSADELSLGRSYVDKKKWAEAADEFRALLKKDPKSAEARAQLGVALTNLGRREDALVILSEGISLLSKTHAKGSEQKFLTRRIRVLSCLFLTNKTFQIYQDGLNLLSGKKYRAARERFEKALLEEPDNVEILGRLGQSYLLDGDYSKAIKQFQLARTLNPYMPEVKLWLGRSLHLNGQSADAIPELHSAKAELKGSEVAPLWLSDALHQAGQTAAAIKILETDAKQWPLHIVSLLNLSKLLISGSHLSSHPGNQPLWQARKNLQLALSRLDQYGNTDFSKLSGDLEVEVSRPLGDIKLEIIRLQEQIDNRLNQTT